MSISIIIKALNFFIAQLTKEVAALRNKADQRYLTATSLREAARQANAEGDGLHKDADKAERIAAKITNIIKD